MKCFKKFELILALTILTSTAAQAIEVDLHCEKMEPGQTELYQVSIKKNEEVVSVKQSSKDGVIANLPSYALVKSPDKSFYILSPDQYEMTAIENSVGFRFTDKKNGVKFICSLNSKSHINSLRLFEK